MPSEGLGLQQEPEVLFSGPLEAAEAFGGFRRPVAAEMVGTARGAPKCQDSNHQEGNRRFSIAPALEVGFVSNCNCQAMAHLQGPSGQVWSARERPRLRFLPVALLKRQPTLSVGGCNSLPRPQRCLLWHRYASWTGVQPSATTGLCP